MSLLEAQTMPQGTQAPDFTLKDTDGGMKSLADFIDKKGVLIAFTCNHCPYAKAAWPLLIQLHDYYKNSIHFVGINPNDAETYPDDSYDAMKEKKKEWRIPFPYLYDESQEAAHAYNAQCTPDLYLFNTDSTAKLYYHGRINDNWQHPDMVKEHNLKDALESLINGEAAPNNQPPSMGCSIKWK